MIKMNDLGHKIEQLQIDGGAAYAKLNVRGVNTNMSMQNTLIY